MEKYLLFAYENYYPCGGMEDCILVANSLEELNVYVLKYMEENRLGIDNMNYYDCQSGKIYEAEFNEDWPYKQFVGWKLQEQE